MSENGSSQVSFICRIPIKINLLSMLEGKVFSCIFPWRRRELKRRLCSIIQKFYDLVLNAKVESD